ncbi:MAG: Fur family transcriptional regulator [Pseudomonadota bacterium]
MSETPCAHSHETSGRSAAQRSMAIEEARTLARDKGLSMTAQRQAIYELLLDADRPVGAYTLINALAKKENRGIAPPTIYRALDFLLDIGVVSRVESSNEFVPCTHPAEEHDCIFLICGCCKRALEVDDMVVNASLKDIAKTHGFNAERQVIELRGLCKDCQ